MIISSLSSSMYFFTWKYIIKLADILLVFNILHGIAPPSLNEFIRQNYNSSTRATTRGHFLIPYR